MKSITANMNIQEVLNHENVVIFYEADWSGHARISKEMINFLEGYIKTKRDDIHFYCGQFEEDLLQHAQVLVEHGASQMVFSGNGSLSFFKNGIHKEDLNSVIGEGTNKVYKTLKKYYGDC